MMKQINKPTYEEINKMTGPELDEAINKLLDEMEQYVECIESRNKTKTGDTDGIANRRR